MKEYRIKIMLGEQGHPLVEVPLVVMGGPANDPAYFTRVVETLAWMLKVHGTPEEVARIIRANGLGCGGQVIAANPAATLG